MEKIEERIYLGELFDLYSFLLTDTQKEIFSDYYLFDLSFSEIGEARNISRAAVEDSLKKSKTKLIEIENNLQILRKKSELQDLFDQYLAAQGKEKEKLETMLKEKINGI